MKKWERWFLNPGADPTRTLNRAYILALAVIAFISIGAHFVTSKISDRQKDSTQIVYELNKQRTQMQQILIYATHYNQMGDPLDMRFLFQSVNEMNQSHEFLVQTASATDVLGKPNSNALERVYFKPPYMLAKNINEYNILAQKYMGYNEKDQQEPREKLIAEMTFQYTNVVQPAIDVALDSYQGEIIAEIERFFSIQLTGVCLILLVLVAEALFIFRPLVKRLRIYNRMMKKYALEDVLTGLNNRRAFLSNAGTSLRRAARDKTPVTVALMDLDHFKNVNDTYGHDVGDTVLKHFSQLVKKSFRSGDVIGRIGGEEFAILLPEASEDKAFKILQRLCQTVENTPCPYENEMGIMDDLYFTVSIGMFTAKEITHETAIEDLMKTADEALYYTKNNGRNGVSCAENITQKGADKAEDAQAENSQGERVDNDGNLVSIDEEKKKRLDKS